MIPGRVEEWFLPLAKGEVAGVRLRATGRDVTLGMSFWGQLVSYPARLKGYPSRLVGTVAARPSEWVQEERIGRRCYGGPLRRRGRDSNPREAVKPLRDFQSRPFVHSGTSP